jgi:predicted MFS family arabinose efflux permease
MKPLPFFILLTVLSHTGFVGSRITVSLSAIDQQASPFTVGLLMALYAMVPMVLAVQAGRFIDRTGVFRPLALSSAAVAAGILLPFAWPGMEGLYVASVVIGTAFMLQHLALNHVVGWIGDPADRAVNFSWLALGYALSGFIGPLLAGFAIDLVGHRMAFLFLALPPLAGTALLLWRRPAVPPVQEARSDAADHRLMDLLREPRLRAVFLFSGLLATGWDLYAFVMPIYGTRIGLSASTIGIVMASFAAATFMVRLAMPLVARRAGEWTVVCTALVVAGIAYSMFPLAQQAGWLMALSFLLGAGLGCAQPMIMAVLYTASPPGRQGEVVGVRTTLMNASHTFLPLLFGAVGAALGMGPVFWTMSALLLSGGVLANKRR